MATTGDLGVWSTCFPNSLVPKVIHLILASWNNFKTSQSSEVLITQEFFSQLSRNQELSELPFLIDLEVVLLNDTGTKQSGRLDIRFIHGYRRKIYFSVECKRLHVNFPSGFDKLASEYVTEGMIRYFNGQYASGLDKGGMLGYVMDGKLNEAVKNVEEAISGRKTDLYMSEGEELKDSSIVSHKQVKETFHENYPEGNFTIYHIFLPLLNCNMTNKRKKTNK